MSMLIAQNLQKSFFISKTIEVLKGVSLEINAGEFVSIMGKSGSGKSTLLTILAGLDKPDSGTVQFEGVDIFDLSENELAKMRKKDIGFVFQSFHLLPTLSVAENILFPLEINAQKNANARVEELLESVGLAHRKDSFPHQLSGGERQRTAIARALAAKPKILFADEPTGNLDEQSAQGVLELLLDLRKASNSALVVVTHDKEIAQLAEKHINIVAGTIE